MSLLGKIVLTVFLFCAAQISWGLVPLESLILGDVSDNYGDEKDDPFSSILDQSKNDDHSQAAYKEALALYRGHITEAINLKNSCENNHTTFYPTSWDQDQSIRSFVAGLQYMGLDISTRALVDYALKFNFTEEEFERFVDSIIGNYCSKNITVIGAKALKSNFLLKFSNKETYPMQDLSQNPLFPNSLTLNYSPSYLDREMLLTVKIFRAMCSWAGEIDNYRMLVPFLKSPLIASHVARKMAALKLRFRPIENSIELVSDIKNSTQVFCTDLICRKVDYETFVKKMPRMVGTKNYKEDFDKMYCQYFRDIDYKNKDQVPQIAQWIKDLSEEEESLMLSHFNALLTGVPDLFVRSQDFKNARELARSSVDRLWNRWAAHQVVNFDKALLYEEALSVEKIERKYYFNPLVPKFSVAFDVNFGELDRALQGVGKIKVGFILNLSKSFLSWARSTWINADPRDPYIRERVITLFNKNIEDQIKKQKKKFIISPWEGALEELISKEILIQLEIYKGRFFNSDNKKEVQIPIVFHYAPFALKHIAIEREQNQTP